MQATERNNAIDMFRLVSAIAVVMLHMNLLADVNDTAHRIIGDGLLRFALPFFFCTSGYYYITALLRGKHVFLRQLFNVLKPYLVWTFIYYAASFVQNVIIAGVPVGTFLMERLVFFFFNGSYYHFWYFPALIYAMILVTVFYKLFGEKGLRVFSAAAVVLYIIGALGLTYYDIGKSIPVLSRVYSMADFETIRRIVCMGFPLFSLGYWVVALREKTARAVHKSIKWLLAGALLLFAAEITLVTFGLYGDSSAEMMLSVYPLTGIIFIALLRHPRPAWRSAAPYARRLANFLFYVHPLIILGSEYATGAAGVTLGTLPLFVLVLVISLILGFVCIKWDNPVTRLLLGERRIRLAEPKRGGGA